MTVHLISVGLSVLDVLADPSRKLAADSDAIKAILEERPAKLLEDEGIDNERDVAKRDEASNWIVGALTVLL